MNSLTQSLSSMINEFSKITQHVSICLGLSVIFILLFIVSPLNTFLVSKVLVITILGYIVCYNTHQTNKFVTKHNINMFGSEWNPVKTNILFSYIFSASLLFLALSLFRKM
jgi:purine-cytosine permease-like protein